MSLCLKTLRDMAQRTIIFEGINGAGKGTAIASVSAALAAKGHHVKVYRDPGSTPVAQKLRTILKDPASNLDTPTQVLLFTAARRLLLNEIVADFEQDPKLIVILDRWFRSTMVYQWDAKCFATVLYDNATPLPVNTTFGAFEVVLDLDARTAMQRVAAAQGQDFQLDAFESQGLLYMESIAHRYLTLPILGPHVIVDATKSAADVAERCLANIEYFLFS